MSIFSRTKKLPAMGRKSSPMHDYQWLCLDVGTENMKARYVNIGLTYDAPSYIAEDYEKNYIYYGEEAKALQDKTNENIVVKRPVRDGNIADPTALEKILHKIFEDFRLDIDKNKRGNQKLFVVMATPSEINPVQRKALEDIVNKLGAERGFIQEEVKMAALGAGQDIFGTAILCIDIGGGSTDIAVISNDSILYSYTTHCAGDFLIDRIKEYIAKKHALKIGTTVAEDIKKTIGSLLKYQDEKSMKISGIALPRQDSKPGETMSISKTIEITAEEIRENVLVVQFREHIIPAIRKVLRIAGDKAPGAISDLKKKGKGITICGGGAYIKNIDAFIQKELEKEHYVQAPTVNGKRTNQQKYEGDQFEVRCAENPLDNVIDGCVKYRDTIIRMLQDEQDPNRRILKKDDEL